jgi:hypothetical protein
MARKGLKIGWKPFALFLFPSFASPSIGKNAVLNLFDIAYDSSRYCHSTINPRHFGLGKTETAK